LLRIRTSGVLLWPSDSTTRRVPWLSEDLLLYQRGFCHKKLKKLRVLWRRVCDVYYSETLRSAAKTSWSQDYIYCTVHRPVTGLGLSIPKFLIRKFKLRETTRCHLEPCVAKISYTNYLHTSWSKKAHNLYTLPPGGDDETTEVTKCASELTIYLLPHRCFLNWIWLL
jgi:hypothetical protein